MLADRQGTVSSFSFFTGNDIDFIHAFEFMNMTDITGKKLCL